MRKHWKVLLLLFLACLAGGMQLAQDNTWVLYGDRPGSITVAPGKVQVVIVHTGGANQGTVDGYQAYVTPLMFYKPKGTSDTRFRRDGASSEMSLPSTDYLCMNKAQPTVASGVKAETLSKNNIVADMLCLPASAAPEI